MYVAPNSTIHILRDVRIDNSYKDTLYFVTDSAQESYFIGKKKYTVTNYTYQRKEMKLRVGLLADNLYDCNYLMFQNTSFGRRWFYAFITNVEYVNNASSDITFEIDVMQTWNFNYALRPSYIERQHTVTDNIGDNLVPENLDFGEYMYQDLGLTSLFELPVIVVAATFDTNLNPAVGGLYGGVYSGLCFNTFADYTTCNTFLANAVNNNKADGIVSIFMFPIAFTSDYQDTIPKVFEIERDKPYTTIDGYKPKCNKLFTYPYQMLYVTNNDGNCANYPFEYFSDTKCKFKLSGVTCCTPEVMAVPMNYKKVAMNYNEKLTIGNFPQCAYAIDSFKAYIAQNAARIATNVAVGGVKAVGGAAAMYASGGIVGSGEIASGATGIAGDLAMMADKSTLPPQAKGVQTSMINFASKIKGFQFYYAHCRREFAEIIDGYFNVYGYAVHKIQTPNVSARPHWTYLKTKNVTAFGDVPTPDMVKIKSIYNNGVTFWKNGNEVGMYNLDNSPTI